MELRNGFCERPARTHTHAYTPRVSCAQATTEVDILGGVKGFNLREPDGVIHLSTCLAFGLQPTQAIAPYCVSSSAS